MFAPVARRRPRRVSSSSAPFPPATALRRLPGKALHPLAGKPMVEHVYRRAARAQGLDRVVVLTDDERIARAVEFFGGEVEMTPAECASGTDRIAWAARNWDCAAVINIQGDEPLIDPTGSAGSRATCARIPATRSSPWRPTPSPAISTRPSVVKVVLDREGYALYFSRAPIPFPRLPGGAAPLRHLGIYGYQKEALLTLAALPQTPLEKSESLEQLRALENRMTIKVLTGARPSWGVDTPEDAAEVDARLRLELGNDPPTTPNPADEERSNDDEVHFRDRRRGFVARQGRRLGVDRRPPRIARLPRHADEVRPLRQRRSGDDVALSARRGLRHRRRHGDRPRPRALRALHPHHHREAQQLHHRPDLRDGDQQGAPRRLSRQDRAGRAAHHRRDQGSDDPRRQGGRRGDRRDRRHGGRHRVAAVPRGDPPVPPRARAQQRRQRPPDAGALHRRRRGVEVEADAALGARAAVDRHPGRRPALPRRPRHSRRGAAEDRACSATSRRSR